ncbi:MAG TPA: hypothetical protein PKK67_00750 [Cyclobacteriaceae bacterium]|nr:hypothetical protein [Cytophagales bacterium]HNT49083.1 hypothetical protein [Cyclobacteriaceae bacterium]
MNINLDKHVFRYMWRLIALAFVGSSVAVNAQIKKQFSVENSSQCAQVYLKLSAKTGNCFIRPSQNQDLLNIYSNQNLEEYTHSFSNEMQGTTCAVQLSLEQDSKRGVSQQISYKMFGREEVPSDKFWKVYLTETTPYTLDLDYGLGNANIDLSGLTVQKLRINTASADVNINYSTGVQNKVDMDTFFVKVDMGSLNVRQLNLARSKVVVADVGFGNMFLDFSSRPTVNNRVIGSVGAGNLVIQLPDAEVPVVVTITDSWLCSTNLSKSLNKIGPNKYANAAYTKNSKDALVFDLNVSMGKIVFREKLN